MKNMTFKETYKKLFIKVLKYSPNIKQLLFTFYAIENYCRQRKFSLLPVSLIAVNQFLNHFYSGFTYSATKINTHFER